MDTILLYYRLHTYVQMYMYVHICIYIYIYHVYYIYIYIYIGIYVYIMLYYIIVYDITCAWPRGLEVQEGVGQAGQAREDRWSE